MDWDSVDDSDDHEDMPEESRPFGRYHLRYRLASGGMASVYLARATGPGGYARPVAVKLMHPHLARRKRFVAMFLDEARIAAQISHPNVCTILDFGEVEGTYYIAMEYLAGVPLSRLLRAVARRGLAMRASWKATAARIVADAAEGLHAAHELRDEADGRLLNVVHRDVSPQNIFVTFDGAVKVVDFGVARAERRLTRTETGSLKGKLPYMAPEHAAGDAIDRRADVWSLGVCLWEALTGRRLFRARNEMDILLAVRSSEIVPPSRVCPELGTTFDDVTLGALQRDPDQRLPDGRSVSRRLRERLRAQPHPAELADLAELMDWLFRDERSEDRARLRTVCETQSGDRPAEGGPAETRSYDPIAGETPAAHGGPVTQSSPAGNSPPASTVGAFTEPLPHEPDAVREAAPELEAETVADAPRGIPETSTPSAGSLRAQRRRPGRAVVGVVGGVLALGAAVLGWRMAAGGKPPPPSSHPAPSPVAESRGDPVVADRAGPTTDADPSSDERATGQRPSVARQPTEEARGPRASAAATAARADSAGSSPSDASAAPAPDRAAAQPANSRPAQPRRSRRDVQLQRPRPRERPARAPSGAASAPDPSTPRGEPGELRIVSRPWASVILPDGTTRNTPFPASLPPGTHRLRYRPNGEGSWHSLEVRVEPGSSRVLRLPAP